MHVCGSQVIGMNDSADATKRMELVPVIVHVLRSAIAPGWRMFNVVLAHLASAGSHVLADLDRFRVNAENILASIYGLRYRLSDTLPKLHRQFSPLVILTTGNQVWNGIRAFPVQSGKQTVFAVKAISFSCYGQSDDFYVREGGYHPAARNISTLINEISCKLFAYLTYFTELCREVVHGYDDST